MLKASENFQPTGKKIVETLRIIALVPDKEGQVLTDGKTSKMTTTTTDCIVKPLPVEATVAIEKSRIRSKKTETTKTSSAISGKPTLKLISKTSIPAHQVQC
jgi:hypothetical protein